MFSSNADFLHRYLSLSFSLFETLYEYTNWHCFSMYVSYFPIYTKRHWRGLNIIALLHVDQIKVRFKNILLPKRKRWVHSNVCFYLVWIATLARNSQGCYRWVAFSLICFHRACLGIALRISPVSYIWLTELRQVYRGVSNNKNTKTN